MFILFLDSKCKKLINNLSLIFHWITKWELSLVCYSKGQSVRERIIWNEYSFWIASILTLFWHLIFSFPCREFWATKAFWLAKLKNIQLKTSFLQSRKLLGHCLCWNAEAVTWRNFNFALIKNLRFTFNRNILKYHIMLCVIICNVIGNHVSRLQFSISFIMLLPIGRRGQYSGLNCRLRVQVVFCF